MLSAASRLAHCTFAPDVSVNENCYSVAGAPACRVQSPSPDIVMTLPLTFVLSGMEWLGGDGSFMLRSFGLGVRASWSAGGALIASSSFGSHDDGSLLSVFLGGVVSCVFRCFFGLSVVLLF